jgi:hypothetical protein
LIVNAAGIDFVNNEKDYEALLREIRRMKGPRQYFNPEPLTP